MEHMELLRRSPARSPALGLPGGSPWRRPSLGTPGGFGWSYGAMFHVELGLKY